jgi:hypothetical protein
VTQVFDTKKGIRGCRSLFLGILCAVLGGCGHFPTPDGGLAGAEIWFPEPELSCFQGRHPRLGHLDAPPTKTAAQVRQGKSEQARGSAAVASTPTVRNSRKARELIQVLSEMRAVIAVSHHPENREIWFHEKLNSSLPLLPPDPWIVAFKANEMPAVSIDPDPRLQDRDNMVVTYFGGTENTRFGQVVFEADRLLKVLSTGFDNHSCAPTTSQLPGFKTKLTLLAEAPATPQFDVWQRMWFSPKELRVWLSADGRVAHFDELAPIRVEQEVLGSVQGAEAVEQAAKDFTNYINKNYAALSSEWPVLQELSRFGTIVSVVNWMRKNGFVDEAWVEHRPKRIATPSRTPAITATWTGPRGEFVVTLATYGGVTFPDNVELSDDGRAVGLDESASRSRPSGNTLSWQSTYKGQLYRTAAVPYEKLMSRPPLAGARSAPEIAQRPIFPRLQTRLTGPLPKVTIHNKSSQPFRITFVPEAGEVLDKTVTVQPKASQTIEVLPANYRIVAKATKAERTDRDRYESGVHYEITYDLIHGFSTTPRRQ